jgi:hypothetical protein
MLQEKEGFTSPRTVIVADTLLAHYSGTADVLEEKIMVVREVLAILRYTVRGDL